MDKYKFGNRICELREQNGYTQRELAYKLKVTDKAISKWENGQSVPRYEKLEAMAELFNVPIESILTDSQNENTFDIDKERLKLKSELNKDKADKIKSIFIGLSVLGVAFPLMLSGLFRLLSFIFTDSEGLGAFSDSLFESVAYFLGIITAIIFVKSVFILLYTWFKNTVQAKENIIHCANERLNLPMFIHYVSAIFSIAPIVILWFDDNRDIAGTLILYSVSIALIAVNCFTQKFSDTSVILTENGFFKESVEYGEFHFYSEAESISSNIDKVNSGLTDKFIISFNIGKERFELSDIPKDKIPLAVSYFNINQNTDNDDKERFRYKIHHYVFMAFGTIVFIFGTVMFIAGNGGESLKDYNKRFDEPLAVGGQTSVIVYDERLYEYADDYGYLNAFDKNGAFLFSIKAKHQSRGETWLYAYNSSLFIYSNTGELLRYTTDGEYLGRCECDFPEDDRTIIRAFDSKDNEAYSHTVEETVQYLVSFDDAEVKCLLYNSSENTYYLCTIGDKFSKIKVDYDEYLSIAQVLDGAVYCDYNKSFITENKEEYFTFRGDLIKMTENEWITLYNQDFFKWYSHSSTLCWLTAATGIIIITLTQFIAKKRYEASIK